MDSPQNIEQQLIVQQQKNERLQQKLQNQEEGKGNQASRRSRKDIEGRDFVCGCGKKYLSYPALYTHIKTKHEGRQPEGTMKYSTTAPAKKTKTKLQQQHLSYLLSQVKREDLKLLDLLAPRFQGTTAISARLKSKILQKQITDTYHSLLKSTSSPLKITKQSTLQQHLVAWLIGAGQFITQKLHDQYQWFARTVKQCFYQMGNEVYTKCFSKKQGGLCYVPNFKIQKVKYFPLICDFYIRFFLPYQYSQLNVNLMELLLTDFCNWLIKKKCTFIEIFLNKEYKFTSPLQIQEDAKSDKDQKSPQDEEKGDQSQGEDGYSDLQLNNKDSVAGDEDKANQQNLDAEQDQDNELEEIAVQKPKENEEKVQQKSQPITPAENIVTITPQLIENTLKSEPQISQSQKNASMKAHEHWSIQPQAASQSSQELPQVKPHAINQEKFQSDAPHHDHQDQQNKDDAVSDKP